MGASSVISFLILTLCFFTSKCFAVSNTWYSNTDQIQAIDMADHFHTLLRNLNGSSNLLELQRMSTECAAHLTSWALNLDKEWSIRMFDAASKLPEGIISGHIVSLGDYDECLATRGQVTISGATSQFKGQYCRTYLFPPDLCDQIQKGGHDAAASAAVLKTMTRARAATPRAPISAAIGAIFQMGFPGGAICTPNKCSVADLQSFFAPAANLGICILVADCVTDDKPVLRTNDITMIAVLGVIAGLCCVGTAVDVLLRKFRPGHNERSKFVQALIAFSLYTNIQKWASTKGGPDNLGCIHGIRFLSTCWVVLGHTWAVWPGKMWNMADFSLMYKDWTIYPILNGTLSVDTFFTVAGFLAAYNLLKVLDKSQGRLNVPLLYLHRYLRLTPTYAILIGIMATWFEYLKPGPHTIALPPIAESCRVNWWHNLLYINNLITYDESDPSRAMCHGESWYLGNDMQFFLLSPLLIWPLWKWRLVGRALMGVFTLASVVVPFVITYVDEHDGTNLVFAAGKRNPGYEAKMYVKPWMRFGPYIVGLLAGYVLYVLRKRTAGAKRVNRAIPTLFVLFGWATSTATALAIMFGPIKHFDPETEYDRVGNAFYAAFNRFGWGVVISWVILACCLGYGSVINAFLSWKAFIPLGRLSFCVYLISYWLQLLLYASGRQYTSYDRYTGINHFFGHMVMSLLVSFVACMAFESPFIALEKLVFQSSPKPPKSPTTVVQTVNTNDDNENTTTTTTVNGKVKV